MNKNQKELLQDQLNKEKAIIKQLENQYRRALNDILNKMKILQADIDMLQAAGESDDKTLSMIRSKVYQKQYQEALKKQIEAILDKLHSDEFSTIQGYLNGCYEDGFIGTMYDIAGQGVPFIFPIDQSAAVKAMQLDSKISKGLYTALGVDVDALKKAIAAEVTRGIASSLPYSDIARNIQNASKAPLNRARTIARTEGHRIQQQSAEDARQAAKSKGADVVKQWDAALDGRTRDSHRQVDGEIRENNERFSNGLRYPGDPHGAAAEVVNCRCVALTRARWALDEDELQTLKDRAEYFGLDKTENFEDYKKKYLKAAENLTDTGESGKISSNTQDIYDLGEYKHISDSELSEWKKQCGVSTKEEYKQIYKHEKADGSKGGYVRSHRAWDFNAEMRNGKADSFDDDDKKTLSIIRELCKRNTTDRSIILDRFVDSDYLSEYKGFFNKHREDLLNAAIEFVKTNMIGFNKVEKSIVSASYGANVLTDRDIHIRLHCPKGTHLFVTKNKRESEVLFHDGLTYEIVGVDKESYKGLFGDKHRLVLDVVVKNYGL